MTQSSDGNGRARKYFQATKVSSFSHQLPRAFELPWRLASDADSSESSHRDVNKLIFNLIFKSRYIFRAFWGITIIAFVIFSISNATTFWRRYLYNPTVVTIDRDYLNRNISFPPITFCLRERLNESAAEEFLM